MLLTALTEILDNVEDENLSPFDTLPDSELLSNQKGREHSPVSDHKLFLLKGKRFKGIPSLQAANVFIFNPSAQENAVSV